MITIDVMRQALHSMEDGSNFAESIVDLRNCIAREEAQAAAVPSGEREAIELVLTFNFGTLVKAVFQDRVLYEVDLSPKPYFQVCWAHGWAGDYANGEDAMDACLSICGYGRSTREVKPDDDGYKNPHYLSLIEQRIPLYYAANQKTVAVPSSEREALIARLRLGSAISRDRNLNADFAELADEAADMLAADASGSDNDCLKAVVAASEFTTRAHDDEDVIDYVRRLAADAQKTFVTCQIYGHVVGACAECNTHAEADGAGSAVPYYENMRLTLINQVHSLIDIAERQSRRMHKQGDTDERDYIDGAIAFARSKSEPYNYNGTKPPAKPLPLTDARILSIWRSLSNQDVYTFSRAIEANHGITGEPI